MVRCWEREGVGQEIERELRAEAQVRETLAAPVVTQRSRDGSAPSRRLANAIDRTLLDTPRIRVTPGAHDERTSGLRPVDSLVRHSRF